MPEETKQQKQRKRKHGKATAQRDSRLLIAEGLRRLRQRPEWKDASNAQIADQLGLAPASISNYINGKRLPPVDAAQKLGDLFFGEQSKRSKEFQEQLAELRAAGDIPGRRSKTLGRVDYERAIRFSSWTNKPFSGDEESFLETILARLVQSGGLNSKFSTASDSEICKAVSNGETDISLGYLMTVDKSVTLHSWKIPFRIGIAALLNGKDKLHRSKVKTALGVNSKLSSPASELEPPLSIHPLVIENDVGATYVSSLKKFGNNITTAKNVDELIQKMAQFSQPTQIPVAVLNELQSFHVLKALNREPKSTNAVPVIPLSSRGASTFERSNLPAYFLSIGCSRQETDFIGLIEQMLVLYISTEVENTSAAIAELHKLLMHEIQAISKEFYGDEDVRIDSDQPLQQLPPGLQAARHWSDAYRWTNYVLSLDKLSIDTYNKNRLPWMTILKRARERIFANITDDQIKNQLALIMHQRRGVKAGGIPSRKELSQLCEVLDIEPSLNETEQELVRCDSQLLLRAIRNASRGLPLGLPIEYGNRYQGGTVKVYPLEDANVRMVIDGYLSELHKFYREAVNALDMVALSLPRNLTPSRRMTRFRQSMALDKDVLRSTKAILAAIGSEEKQIYLSSALIRPYDPRQSDQLSSDELSKDHFRLDITSLTEASSPGMSLELLFLWTPPQYRHLGVAGAIVHEAKQELKKSGLKFLVVEIFQTMNEQIAYFINQGFTRDDVHLGTGRLLYKFENPY